MTEITSLTNAVRLDWNATENTTSWTVYRSSVKGELGEILTSGLVTTTYTDSNATGGIPFYYVVQANNADVNTKTNSDQMTGLPYTELVYENKLVDFVGYTAWTVYGTTEATNDFGNVFAIQGDDRLKIDTSERLRFELPIGQYESANTGGIIKAHIAGKDEYTLEYEIRFDAGFPWSKGGKIAGLSGGVGYTGGEPAWAGDGFSVRMMWRENGKIIPYVYHTDQPDIYGDHFGLSADGIGYFTNTQAHKVKYYVKLNTGDNKDGILQIWLDDVSILYKNDLRFRTNDCQIDTCHIAVFAGGSTADWAMTDTGYIRLSYMQWQ